MFASDVSMSRNSIDWVKLNQAFSQFRLLLYSLRMYFLVVFLTIFLNSKIVRGFVNSIFRILKYVIDQPDQKLLSRGACFAVIACRMVFTDYLGFL